MRGLLRSLTRIRAISVKEFRHLRRDRLTGGMIAGIPTVLTLLFGYAINQDVRHLGAGVVDLAETQRSRSLISDSQATQVIDILHRATSVGELEDLLRRGEISVGLVIPPDFETRVEKRDRPAAQLLVDGGDPIVLASARALTNLPLEVSGSRAPDGPATYELRAYYNPERRSAVFIVPGLCGVILTLTMVLFTSIAIVRERERGNLELLIATPIRTLELMIGKVAPYVVIGYVQVTLILTFAVLLFDVPIRGELSDFYIGAGVFIAAVLSLGLFISTVATTQFQAFQMTFVSFLPQMLLSGFMFPFDGMPPWVRSLSELFPLTHFIRVVRGILLRGADLRDVWSDIWPLAAFFVVMMSLAVVRFRKRLD